MRTTLDLDPGVLRDLKARARREGRSLGRVASELLAAELAGDRPVSTTPLKRRCPNRRPRRSVP